MSCMYWIKDRWIWHEAWAKFVLLKGTHFTEHSMAMADFYPVHHEWAFDSGCGSLRWIVGANPARFEGVDWGDIGGLPFTAVGEAVQWVFSASARTRLTHTHTHTLRCWGNLPSSLVVWRNMFVSKRCHRCSVRAAWPATFLNWLCWVMSQIQTRFTLAASTEGVFHATSD